MRQEDDFWSVLLIDDDEEDFILTRDMLRSARRGKFKLEWGNSYRAGMEKLLSGQYDVVLVDYDLGAGSGVELIREAHAAGIQIPFLLVTGQGNLNVDLEGMHAGALDYLVKSDLNSDMLERSIRYAIDRKRIESELSAANRKLTEAYSELNQERSRLRTLIDHAPSGILLTDSQGKILFVNPAAEKLLNGHVSGSGILPEGSFSLHHMDGTVFPADELPLSRALLLGTVTESVEVMVRHHKTGHELVVLKNSAPIRDDAGRLGGAVAVMQDVTEFHRAEKNTRLIADLGEKLITLEEPGAIISYAVRAIALHLNVDRCILDEVDHQNKMITVLSEYYRDTPGFTGLIGKYPIQSWHEQLEHEMRRGHPAVVTDSATHPITRELFEQAFRPYGFRSFVSVPRVVDGCWLGTLNVVSDLPRAWRADEIALLKQAGDLVWLAVENARLLNRLKTAQDRFEVAIKNTDISVFTTDLERRYTWIHNWRLGGQEQEIIGCRAEEIFSGENLQEIIDLENAVLKSGKGIRKEVNLDINGKPSFMDITIEPMHDADDMMTGLIVAAQDTTHRRQMEVQMRETADNIAIQREILQHREDERQMIARNLHDGPVQDLISLLFSIQTALTLAEEQDMVEVLNELRDETQKLVGELRGVCNELRPPTLVQFGLSKAIQSHSQEFQEKHKGIQLHLELMEDGRMLPDSVRLALYRIYQECLNNVVRHARATEVRVQLILEPDRVKMQILDNGIGFEAPADWVSLARNGHLGLVGMKERLEAVQGKMSISSNPGRGTSIAINVPISRGQEPFKPHEGLRINLNPL